MLISGSLLILLYILFKYVIAWIVYYNSTDNRFQKSIWRWTYDYRVKGKRDISVISDLLIVILE